LWHNDGHAETQEQLREPTFFILMPMKWYYVDQGQQAGPVDDAKLDELFRNAVIQPDTLVWCEGMANWMPYSQARNPAGAAPAPAAPPPAAYAAAASGEAPVEAVCSECGRIFPKDNMIRHGEAYVCAGCKPVFMQKLAEGAKLNTGTLNCAGFWIRFAAVFLDGIVLWIVSVAIRLASGMNVSQAVGIEAANNLTLHWILTFIQFALGISYETFMIGKYGATLGKMACKIEVVTADGGKVSYLRAFGRYFAKLLSYMICLIGYIMAGFDGQKRALHDHICNTRVVFK
jgi:uncharacterized RDD family membrane protein YckC